MKLLSTGFTMIHLKYCTIRIHVLPFKRRSESRLSGPKSSSLTRSLVLVVLVKPALRPQH
jgi:hypothetical protein